jgi:hypothetical protein
MDELNIRKSAQHNCANCNWISITKHYHSGGNHYNIAMDCILSRSRWDIYLEPTSHDDGITYAVDTPGSQICNKWSKRE